MKRDGWEDHYGRRAPSPAEQLAGTMFDLTAPPPTPPWAQRWGSLTDEQRKRQRERWQEQLQPLVLDLAARRGPEGITASDVISAGITAGILNGERLFLKEYPRVYAFIGPWLAQLARTGTLRPKTARLEGGGEIHVKRESSRDVSHGNANLVYVRAA
jgi:hypothetical protein